MNENPTPSKWWTGLPQPLRIGLTLTSIVLVFLAGRWIWLKLSTRILTAQEAEKSIRETLAKSKYVTLSDWIVAQAKHESDNFQSDLYKRAWNPFGMGHPKVRPTTSQGESNGYAVYSSIPAAVEDLEKYFDYWSYKTSYPSVEEYVTALKTNGEGNYPYFTDSYENYLAGLKRFL